MFVFTFDTDWAPQFVLDYVLDLLCVHGLKGTVFCTGPYSGLDRPGVEVGLHPNLMVDSTHGPTEGAALAHLKSVFPGATGVRTHRLYWHGGLYVTLPKHSIVYDSSLLMPLHPGLEPHRFGELVRFPVWWSERIHLDNAFSMDGFAFPARDKPGLKVLLFHPIHIYLNTVDMAETQQQLADLPRLEDAGPSDLEPLRNDGMGIGTIFRSCLEHVGDTQESHATLGELTEAFTRERGLHE